MTPKIDLSAAREALAGIQTVDPRVTALSELMNDIKSRIDAGASMKQITGTLAPHFGGDEKFVARTIAQLRRRRGGRKSKPAKAAATQPAIAKPGRLSLKPAAVTVAANGAPA